MNCQPLNKSNSGIILQIKTSLLNIYGKERSEHLFKNKTKNAHNPSIFVS